MYLKGEGLHAKRLLCKQKGPCFKPLSTGPGQLSLFLRLTFTPLLGAPRCGSGPNWCLEGPPPGPHCNWRTLPSSQTPSLPALSFPLPPPHPPWLFLQGSGRGRPGWWGRGRGPRAQGGEGVGGASKRSLGPDPHLGALHVDSSKPRFATSSSTTQQCLKCKQLNSWIVYAQFVLQAFLHT